MADCKEAVFGLTQLFKVHILPPSHPHTLTPSHTATVTMDPPLQTKLYSPSPLVAQIFSLLVDIVQQQYDHATFLPPACVMRVNVGPPSPCAQSHP